MNQENSEKIIQFYKRELYSAEEDYQELIVVVNEWIMVKYGVSMTIGSFGGALIKKSRRKFYESFW